MLKNDPRFTRLKVGGVSWNGRTTYWLGPDHLLAVTTKNFEEAYQRFYFADVGAVVLRRTRTWLWRMAVAGLVGVLLGIWLLSLFVEALRGGFGEDMVAGLVCLGIPVVAAFAVLLVEILGGPSCQCRVHTAVQTRELLGINRWRRAERLLEALEPRIRQAQGVSVIPEVAPASGVSVNQGGAGDLPQ